MVRSSPPNDGWLVPVDTDLHQSCSNRARCLWPDGGFGFVNYDDGSYVFENANIRAGLTWHGVVWAFTHIKSQNWHPLTSVSHMLDCEIQPKQSSSQSAQPIYQVGTIPLFTARWPRLWPKMASLMTRFGRPSTRENCHNGTRMPRSLMK